MFTVLLTVLKIIGWTLLALLILLVLILSYALIVPIRYSAAGCIKEKIFAKIEVYDLLRSFRLTICLGKNKKKIKLRFLFFTVGNQKKPPEEETAQLPLEEEVTEEIDTFSEEDFNPEAETAETAEESPGPVEEESPDTASEDEEPEAEAPLEEEEASKAGERKKKKKKEPPEEEEKPPSTVKRVIDGVQDVRNQEAVKHLTKEFVRLLIPIIPHIKRIKLCYGTGTPDLTGQVTGFAALLPLSAQKDVRLKPDFETEKPYGRGVAEVAGKVRIGAFVMAAVRIVLDKNCRYLYRQVRNR